MKTVCEVLNVARSNIAVRAKAPLAKTLGRPPQPDCDLVAEVKSVIGGMPTYGYRRVWAVLRRQADAQGRPRPNHKRIYRIMKAHGLLLQRHAGGAHERRHDGRIAVDRSNLMASNWVVTTATRSASRSRSIAATGKPWALL